eukprot:9501647-Pyramimonas_sp.AAC.1
MKAGVDSTSTVAAAVLESTSKAAPRWAWGKITTSPVCPCLFLCSSASRRSSGPCPSGGTFARARRLSTTPAAAPACRPCSCSPGRPPTGS